MFNNDYVKFMSVYVVLYKGVYYYNYVVEQMRKIRDGFFEVYAKEDGKRIKRRSNFNDVIEHLPRYARNYSFALALSDKEMYDLVLESL